MYSSPMPRRSKAVRAAACSASFRVVPVPSPWGTLSMRASTTNIELVPPRSKVVTKVGFARLSTRQCFTNRSLWLASIMSS
ncbi:hypothetical protein ATCV1_z064R [Acanthocystis turfacea chlorella virus 1]|uniref:Uncharacterized protein z064R n=1 Tax=Chlorovirus heliozoae TaxID=322019 RepID=A7K824_9PHYC|nr:hypothetical protein ATCV1_z064R [Acanthocystis turfacea chlorella virus 1]ABT16198.1 hypothetical protein ATCV1_z064R [Acanthocystis turfacea chlorella virus 1]